WEEVYAKDDIFNWMRQQRRGGIAKAGPVPAQPTVAVVDAVKPGQGKGVVVSSSAPQPQRATAVVVSPTPVRVQAQRPVVAPKATAAKARAVDPIITPPAAV